MQTRGTLKAVLKHLFFDKSKVTEEMVDRYYDYLQSKGGRKHFLGTLRSYYELDEEELLKMADQVKIKGTPVFLIWTEKDPDMPLADAPLLAKRLGAKLKTIPNCGHIPQLELDDEELRAELILPIQNFLKGSENRIAQK